MKANIRDMKFNSPAAVRTTAGDLSHAHDVSHTDRVRRDVCASVIANSHDRRSDKGNPPVIRLKLLWLNVRPDGKHGLERVSASDIGESKVKGGRGDTFEFRPSFLRIGLWIEKWLDHVEDDLGYLLAAELTELLKSIQLEDRIDNACLTVKNVLATSSWLALKTVSTMTSNMG
ncbi:hypothetical protein HG530_009059 [Fusarium avenaceum]|nr:hypothetical protein HG530_009059 [Fusarium avenaceum]